MFSPAYCERGGLAMSRFNKEKLTYCYTWVRVYDRDIALG